MASVRVSDDMHQETRRVAALRGDTPGALLAEAWKEYMLNHKEEFAAELEQAARIVRNGTQQDLVDFANRNNREKAERAAARIRSKG